MFSLHKMRVKRWVFYPMISKRSCYVQHCTCTQKVAMHCMFNIKQFQACFSTFYFTWEKCVQCAFALQRMRVERRVFFPKISQRSCYVQHCTCNQKYAMHSMFNVKEFQACFSTFYFTLEICVKCAFALNRMRVERRVFYPKIIQRSCYVLHCSYTQKVAIHCIFNIKEFQA